ncbi:MAG: hypothetical protein Q9192_004634, partial [Flavoplaca navasiana]
MDALCIISHPIVKQRVGTAISPRRRIANHLAQIVKVFERSGPCTKSAEHLEDFNDTLKDFSEEAKTCARLATEIRVAFNKWGHMDGELHASTEQKKGLTSIDKENTGMEQAVAGIEKTFADQNSKEAENA